MEQRIEFALKALRTLNFRELYREYGISPKTGYKWRQRLLEHGLAGLNELSRRPHEQPQGLGEAVVCAMVRLKQAHPHWGPRKIQALYARQHEGAVPSESSFKRVRVPAEVYRPSARTYEGTPEDLDYGGMETRRVKRKSGAIFYRNEKILISAALGGWSVGLSARGDGLVEVWFSRLLLGHLDPTTASFQAARSGGLEAGQLQPE